jgi:hypothetical protein
MGIISVTVILFVLVCLWAFLVNAHLRGCLARLDEILQAEKCTRPQRVHTFHQHGDKKTNHTTVVFNSQE